MILVGFADTPLRITISQGRRIINGQSIRRNNLKKRIVVAIENKKTIEKIVDHGWTIKDVENSVNRPLNMDCRQSSHHPLPIGKV